MTSITNLPTVPWPETPKILSYLQVRRMTENDQYQRSPQPVRSCRMLTRSMTMSRDNNSLSPARININYSDSQELRTALAKLTARQRCRAVVKRKTTINQQQPNAAAPLSPVGKKRRKTVVKQTIKPSSPKPMVVVAAVPIKNHKLKPNTETRAQQQDAASLAQIAKQRRKIVYEAKQTTMKRSSREPIVVVPPPLQQQRFSQSVAAAADPRKNHKRKLTTDARAQQQDPSPLPPVAKRRKTAEKHNEPIVVNVVQPLPQPSVAAVKGNIGTLMPSMFASNVLFRLQELKHNENAPKQDLRAICAAVYARTGKPRVHSMLTATSNSDNQIFTTGSPKSPLTEYITEQLQIRPIYEESTSMRRKTKPDLRELCNNIRPLNGPSPLRRVPANLPARLPNYLGAPVCVACQSLQSRLPAAQQRYE